ncbi:MAG: hypothetical protein WCJ80_11935 [Bacteroidota bacterium]
MSINVEKVSSDMLSAIKGSVGNQWGSVKDVATQFLQNDKERLLLIAEMRLKEKLTDAEFRSQIDDEKLMMEAELNAVEVLSKAVAQKAANAALDVLQKAVLAAIV